MSSKSCLDTLNPAWKVIAEAFRRHASPEDGVRYLASLTFVQEEAGAGTSTKGSKAAAAGKRNGVKAAADHEEARYKRAGRKLIAEIRDEILRTLPEWERVGAVIREWLKKRGIPEKWADAKTAEDHAIHSFLVHARPLLTIYSDPGVFFQRKDFDAFAEDFDEEREPDRRLTRLARVLNRWGFAALGNDRVRIEFDRYLSSDPAAFLRLIGVAESRDEFRDGRPKGKADLPNSKRRVSHEVRLQAINRVVDRAIERGRAETRRGAVGKAVNAVAKATGTSPAALRKSGTIARRRHRGEK